ncbi:MAG: ABC transporter permease [Gammaproteobacteria bacterium]|nr:ABC transporter permease [Gammaproteobacteria bacterium]
MTTDAGTRRMELIGGIAAGDPRVARGLLLADIATAQELLGEQGWLTRIDLVRAQSRPGSAPAMLLERLFPGLVVQSSPPVVAELENGLRIESLADRGADTRALASAFQLDLAALGLLAIVVGLFLIHGTLRYSVLRRQRQFGKLRALGVTPAELSRMILLEAAVLGVLGVLLGLALGRILAGSLLGLVSATLEGIYDQVAIGALSPDPVPWLKGALVGFGGALAAAWPVARRAGRVSPLELQSGILSIPSGPRRILLQALFWALVAGLALLPGTGHVGGLVAIAALLLLGAVLAPVLIRACLGGLARLSGRAPVGVRMLLREAGRGLGRSGVAGSALVVAIATAVGMGLMVESFRGSVEQWLETRLAAPLYLRLPDGEGRPLPTELMAAVEAGSSGWVERHAFPDRVEGRPVTVALVRTAWQRRGPTGSADRVHGRCLRSHAVRAPGPQPGSAA